MGRAAKIQPQNSEDKNEDLCGFLLERLWGQFLPPVLLMNNKGQVNSIIDHR